MDAEPDANLAVPAARARRLLAGALGHARRTARIALDVVMPPQCLSCGGTTGSSPALCASCWSRLRLIEKPYCARLGIPFSYDLGEGALSAEAIADPPPFDRCRAVAGFDEVARTLVHALKYRDRGEVAGAMGGWMVRAGGEVIAGAGVIVPVPLHPRRLWSRRFNQSAMLASVIARASQKPFAPAALARVRATPQQVGMTAKQRADNMRGAFRVPVEQRITVAGRRVLLVDEVYTTGATVKAATRSLIRAGALAVDVLVFARVVRGEN